MANKKATMTDLRLLIREFIKGTSKRKISEILNLSRTSIDVYLWRMDASGKSAEELLHSDDKTLSQVMVRDRGHRNTDSEKLDELTPLLEDYARQMQLRNMTYQLLFENYSQRVPHPYGYTQFKEKIQAYEKAHSYSFHNVYEPAKCKSDNTADIKYGLWARGGDEVADSLKKANGGRPVVPGGCVGKPYNHYCFNCMYQW